MHEFLTAFASGVGLGSIYCVVALGYSFVYRTTASFNFAQGQAVVLGTLFTYTFYVKLGIPAIGAGIAVCIVVAAIGGLTERVAIWPLVRRGDETLKWLMSTLGMAVLFTGASLRIWGSNILGIPNYLSSPVTHFGSVRVSSSYVLAFAVAVALAITIEIFQRFTFWGRILRAVGDNRLAVELAGVNVVRMGFWAFVLSGVLAGAAGFVIGPVTFADPNAGFNFAILSFAALAIGGFQSHWGALIGGFAVGLAESLGGTYLGLQYQDLVVFGMLILILVIRPEGVMAGRQARHV
jgi:branched-chain amino acid transport system permease protein